MKLIVLITLSVLNFFNNNEPKVVELRGLFYKASESKASALQLSKILDGVDDKSAPILLCYKGVADMMEAKHLFNPIYKLSRFNAGKAKIEEAIRRDPDDLEMRFLRFSIQNNLPGFLGYKEQIDQDKAKLLTELDQLRDDVLKKNIVNYLMVSGKCTDLEMKRLKQNG